MCRNFFWPCVVHKVHLLIFLRWQRSTFLKKGSEKFTKFPFCDCKLWSGTGTLGRRQVREGKWRFRPRHEHFGRAQSWPSASVRRPRWAARHALSAARRSGADTAIPAAGRSSRFPDCDSSLPRAIAVFGAEILALGGTILENSNFCKESGTMIYQNVLFAV